MESKSTLHVGEIIRIVDPFTIIINAGNDRLKAGDKVQIYVLGEMLYNLDGSSLAHYEHIKDELDVIRAEKHYSVCRKNKVIEITFELPLSPMLESTLHEEEPLRINSNDIQHLPKYDNTIHIGDFVKLVDK